MTKEEAIKAMKQGQRVTHKYFSPNEWVTINKSGEYLFEDGYTISEQQFWKLRSSNEWETGWSIKQ